MAEVKLTAESRDAVGKGAARKIRAAGKVPAVLYGPAVEPMRLAVDALQLWHALHTDAGTNVLINLAVDGDTFLTMPREVQRDIVRGTLLHVDFLRIRRGVAIQVDVPIHLVGESVGVKEGGVVEHHLWELRIECLPTQVPESLEADISRLAINDALHVSDLRIPQHLTVLTPAEETIVSVVPPPILEVPEEEVPEEELPEGEVPEGEVPPPRRRRGGGPPGPPPPPPPPQRWRPNRPAARRTPRHPASQGSVRPDRGRRGRHRRRTRLAGPPADVHERLGPADRLAGAEAWRRSRSRGDRARRDRPSARLAEGEARRVHRWPPRP